MYAQMKSFLAAGCLFAASTLSVVAFEAVTVEPSELRQGAAWDFAPIVRLPPGSIVEVLNCDRRWCEVGIEDYDGFLPRGVLDLGGSFVPFYAFPPQIAAPALWHGRYYSRDHYRFESRARWRDRDDRRLYELPLRVQPRPLPPSLLRIEPGDRRGPSSIQPMPKQGQPKGGLPGDRAMPPQGQPPAQRVMPSPQTQPQPQPRQVQPQPQPQPRQVQPQPQPQPRQVQPQSQPQPRPQAQPQAPAQRQAPPPPPPQPQPQKKKQEQKG